MARCGRDSHQSPPRLLAQPIGRRIAEPSDAILSKGPDNARRRASPRLVAPAKPTQCTPVVARPGICAWGHPADQSTPSGRVVVLQTERGVDLRARRWRRCSPTWPWRPSRTFRWLLSASASWQRYSHHRKGSRSWSLSSHLSITADDTSNCFARNAAICDQPKSQFSARSMPSP